MALALFASSSLSLNAGLVGRSAVAQRCGAAHMGVEQLVGASEEISGKVWDPLGLSDNMDEGNLNLVRAAELKHGRVAMLATVGWAWTATGAALPSTRIHAAPKPPRPSAAARTSSSSSRWRRRRRDSTA